MDFGQLFICLYCLFTSVRLTTGEDCRRKEGDFCSCDTSRGTVDLHSLVVDQPNPRFSISDGTYTYDFEPCKSLTKTCGSKTDGVAVCQRKGADSYVAGLTQSAKFSGVPFGNSKFNLTFSSETQGTLRRYFYFPRHLICVGRGHPTHTLQKSVTSVFHITCAEVEGKLVSVKEEPLQSGNYLFELQTKYACLSAGGNTDDNKKISTGSVLLILFFSLISLYFVIGILYLKFFGGAQGKEMIPNYEFWSSLPGYIKDGFMFTCRGCKSESSYSQI